MEAVATEKARDQGSEKQDSQNNGVAVAAGNKRDYETFSE